MSPRFPCTLSVCSDSEEFKTGKEPDKRFESTDTSFKCCHDVVASEHMQFVDFENKYNQIVYQPTPIKKKML
eukprot:3520688-Amphidinium_carterae.1